ncbi:flagellar basal-body MS-ring/collar protein FliF [Sphingomonas japonica]|uniref:Flagellar M-ring protein n=1 Tax=Sphingomonas japonica TaxID=511662 RepID=A0ABX0U019_9SPHN|nr:flagellar basal-body MS-ring/collar protein FliF [Sphingomonas japonica]NIJ23833.1 flagellar M-ring protein FliF [Sphingomonas japonica]
MSQILAPIDGKPVAAPSGLAGRFDNPLKQVSGFMAQPAFKRALPMILMVGLIAAAALAWMLVQTPPQRVLFTQLTDADKGAVSEALSAAQIDNAFDQSGALTVAEDDYHRARMLLASQDLPKAAPGGYAILDDLPMGVSRAVEGERLRQARETELARSIEEIDSVADARVHLAMPESSVFVRDRASPSASVIVRLEAGRALSEAQVRSIVNLTASSVPGMKPDAVTIVDQMGALLSRPEEGGGIGEAGDARIEIQRRIEDKYRAQLTTLLTPLVGPDNFSAEVQAEVDLDESQATRETYDKEGVIRAEQGQWSGASGQQAPGGIPGALSNTAPAPSTLTDPAAQAAAAAGVDPNAAAPAAPPVAGAALPKASEEFARAYDLGKEISVTRQAPGGIKRLSVAVLLRDPEGGKPRSAAEIKQINDLVKAAVGFSAERNDQVTVISRQFSASAIDGEGPSWYEADWVPMVARNGTALVIALLVLLLGVRPLLKMVGKNRDEPGSPQRAALAGPDGSHSSATEQTTPGQAPVSIDRLAQARGYDERVGLVRGFTRDNPARAALAVRDMIKADAS